MQIQHWRMFCCLMLSPFAVAVDTLARTPPSSLPHPLTPALPAYSRVYSAQRNPFEDAVHAIALAKRTGRYVLIEIGGNWCVWCKKFDLALASDKKLYRAFHSRFVFLKINSSKENDNQAFIKGLPSFIGYPHFFVSDGNGRIFHSQSPTDFVSNGEFVVADILDFVSKVSAQPLSENEVHEK